MSKIYGVYMAYTKYEVLPDEDYKKKFQDKAWLEENIEPYI